MRVDLQGLQQAVFDEEDEPTHLVACVANDCVDRHGIGRIRAGHRGPIQDEVNRAAATRAASLRGQMVQLLTQLLNALKVEREEPVEKGSFIAREWTRLVRSHALNLPGGTTARAAGREVDRNGTCHSFNEFDVAKKRGEPARVVKLCPRLVGVHRVGVLGDPSRQIQPLRVMHQHLPPNFS